MPGVKKYVYETNTVVNDLKILSKTKSVKNNGMDKNGKQIQSYIKSYICECLICGDISTKNEYSLNVGKGCKCKKIKTGIRTSYKYDTGEIFNDFMILEKTSKKTTKGIAKAYNCVCLKCDYKFQKLESDIANRGCPCCCKFPRVVVEHINSIVANEETHWMVDYFQGGWNEAKLYTPSSSKSVVFKCPDCGSLKDKPMAISVLNTSKSIACKCSDGISYPEKFMMSFFEHININYQRQYMFDGFKYKYDLMVTLNGKDNIIETHGIQHYKDCNRSKFLDVKDNDMLKYDVSVFHGFEYNKNYHVIDCRHSEIDWIKSHILKNNILKELIQEKEVDWLAISKNAERNLVKDVCLYYMNNKLKTFFEIGGLFNLTDVTVRNYLKKGAFFGWCDYIANDKQNKRNKNKRVSKAVFVYKNDTVIGSFSSVKDLVKQSENNKNIGVKLTESLVRQCCLGNRRHHKGFVFKYVD